VKTKNSSADNLGEETKQALEAVLKASRMGDHEEVLRLFLKDQAQHIFPKGQHTLKWLTDRIGRRATSRLVGILSEAPCFNCRHGLLGCDNCENTGHLGYDFVCEWCLSLGRVPCGFCDCTGLASIDFIPLGLRLAVFAIRIKNAEKRLDGLLQIPTPSAESAVAAFNKRAELLFALNREISVLQTTVGVAGDLVTVPRNLRGRVTRITNEAVRIAAKSTRRLSTTVETMLNACKLCAENAQRGSKAHKLAMARVKYFGALLDTDPPLKGTYFEHPLLTKAADRLTQKKKSRKRR